MDKDDFAAIATILMAVGAIANFIMVFKAQTDEWKGLFFTITIIFIVGILRQFREYA